MRPTTLTHSMLASCALGLFLLAGCANVDDMPEPDFADIEAATMAASELKTQLRAELISATEANGAAEAEMVCTERAAEMAREITSASGYEVHMVTLGGETDAFEARILTVFEEALASGVNPRFMEHSEVVLTETGEAEFRWMKPIFAGQALAVCHEANMEAAAADLLARGGEEATEFTKGDLRGAFSMSKSLELVELAELETR